MEQFFVWVQYNALWISLVIQAILLVLVVLFFCLTSKRSTVRRVNLEVQRQAVLIEKNLRDELARNRDSMETVLRQERADTAESLRGLNETLMRTMTRLARLQQQQMEGFTRQLMQMDQQSEQRLERVRETMEVSISQMREENSRQLDKMRATVDEKLNETLEKRLGESFQLVSTRLEEVYKGLGEMQSLATGVGDLKKVLANIKTRGIWGEVSLGNLLEQILSTEQYGCNVATKPGSNERVEFAIRLPGQHDQAVWLPIDAKFPQEDYQRLLDANDQADAAAAEQARKALEARIRLEAKNVRQRYIAPPYTTDFAVIFLPIEGLYAEVLRIPGLCDTLQTEYRVVLAGPTTLAALLNSLQMGFKTLAVEKRTSEVWMLLRAVKTEFDGFAMILAKTQKKLQEATNTIEDAAKSTRKIRRKLGDVQQLPENKAIRILDVNEDLYE